MPNIPNVPGVPALSSYLSGALVLLTEDAISLLTGSGAGAPYDVLLDGASAFDFNSIGTFAFKQQYSISDYKVEPGSFVSYDKVQNPASIRLRMISEGTPEAMTQLLQELLAANDDTNLYDIATPQQTFIGYNMGDLGIEQSATDGVGMLIADMLFIQIREGDAAAFSNTQQPGSAGQTGTGNVQAQDLTPQDQNAISAAGVM